MDRIIKDMRDMLLPEYVKTQKIRTHYVQDSNMFIHKYIRENMLTIPFSDISNQLEYIQQNIRQNINIEQSDDFYKKIKTFADYIDEDHKTVIGLQIINKNLEILYCIYNSEKTINYYIAIFC